MAFSGAQVFYVDPNLVKNSPSVSIDRIDLYFKGKPQATGNKSGIASPGVQLYLTGTSNGVPVLPTNLSALRSARAEYSDVHISSDASLATTFRFDPPVPFQTGKSAAIIIRYDGDEDYVLWTDVTGDLLVGTTTVSTGASTTSGVGGYYSFISAVPSQGSANNTSNSNIVASGTAGVTPTLADQTYASTSWQAKVNTVLKFSVYVARYAVSGDTNLANYVSNTAPANSQIKSTVTTTTTSNGEILYTIPQDRYEYLAYDKVNSTVTNISAGERVFPVLPLYPPGSPTPVTLNCVQNSNIITATGNINFSTLLNIGANQPNHLVIISKNHLGANADIVNLRAVTAILSNTKITVDQPLNFTNSVANFWMAPIATVDQLKTAKFFGLTQSVAICKGSTANSKAFFTPYSINSVSVAAGGSGYANSDYVVILGNASVTGKVLNGYSAIGNLTTNSTGGITGIYLSNVGSYFSNSANISFYFNNANGAATSGTGANLTFTVGTNIKGEFLGFDGKGGNFANVHPIDIEVGQVLPALLVSNPAGTYYNASLRFPYYSVDDIANPSGRQTYCDADNQWDVLNIQTFNIHQPFEFSKRRCLPSWSNELFTPYANGTSSAGLGGTSNGAVVALTSNASVISVTTVSNNDFVAATAIPSGSKITYSRYVINNDYTNEHTLYGNSWAKGIETKFNLASNTLAEDLLVYATVYKPANTDVLCFAKVYNTHDNDSFDSKDWTMLQVLSGNGVVSSPTNLSDTFELTWGFQKYPNVAFQFSGSVTTANGSTTITGSGTNFGNLVSGDLIMIQNNLFQNNYMVAVVNTVASNTSLTISKPVANLNLVGSGFSISKLNYKHQAFNNYLNDNVVRYYSSTMSENDGFNSCAIKLVMLSANGLLVPLIGDVRAVAVSA